ncbi:MAG: thioredoxin domain-containing protein [Acidobacteriaceae bacterium]
MGALLAAAAGCVAQQPAGPAPAAKAVDTTPAAAASLNRKIEVMIRSELNVPPQYEVAIGSRQKSDVAGYDTLPVTFSLPGQPGHAQTVDFLLSSDGNTLARLSKWNIGPDPGALLPTEGRPIRGNPQAKITIVNFDDLECPYCARMHAEFFPQTLDRYKGLVKFVYVDYPLIEIHPWAMHAAVDANCLADENGAAYWNYVDYLHVHGQDVSGPDNDPAKAAATLDKLASQEGDRDHIDAAKLSACLAKQDDSKVEAEMKAGDKVGVNATPTFFVNGERWAGQLDEQELWAMIDRALVAQGITPPHPDTPAPATAASPGHSGN